MLSVIHVIFDTIHTYLVIRIPGPALPEVFIVTLIPFTGDPPNYILVHISPYNNNIVCSRDGEGIWEREWKVIER
jgi:hypothetical protein